jgi:hypothetical protein
MLPSLNLTFQNNGSVGTDYRRNFILPKFCQNWHQTPRYAMYGIRNFSVSLR